MTRHEAEVGLSSVWRVTLPGDGGTEIVADGFVVEHGALVLWRRLPGPGRENVVAFSPASWIDVALVPLPEIRS